MEQQARAGYRSQVTKIANEANEYLKASNVRDIEDLSQLDDIEEELSSYLQRLTTAHENLCAINQEFQVKGLENKNPEKMAEYEDTAVGVLAKLKVRLAKVKQKLNPIQNEVSVQRALTPAKSHCTNLPKLQLKTFSGDHQEWLPFWENFRANIHENDSLSGADKFNYLQTVLTGNAANTISGFTPTDACYDGAISLLQEEYGDKEKLIDKLMQELMALPMVQQKTDVKALRLLYNTVIACSRSLTSLGVPSSHYYIMLKTILLKCMPSELRIDYHRLHKETPVNLEESESTSDSGSTLSFDGDKQVKNILRFLKEVVESIERAAIGRTTKSTSNVKHTGSTISTAAGLLTPSSSSSNTIPCFFCKSIEHITRECEGSRSIEEKKQMLKGDGRCFRCTYKGHTAKFCHCKTVVCKICKRRHATTLCEANQTSVVNFVNENSLSNSTDDDSNGNGAVMINPTFNLCVQNVLTRSVQKKVYLQTARVLLSSPVQVNKTNLFVRIIIDGGSQRTFVRETVANKLQLPLVGVVNLSVIPFGNAVISKQKELKTVKICLQCQYSGRSVELIAVVVPEICLDVLPRPENHIAQLSEFTLADTNPNGYEQEQGLSVLIGADYFWKVVTGKYKRLTDRLTAVHTIFGWTIQGPSIDGENSISNENISTLCSLSVEKLWNLECLGIRKDENEMRIFTNELQAKCIHKTTTRYEASLPWKNLDVKLGTNKDNALSLLHSLVKRLSRDPAKLEEYDTTMRELISAGFAEIVPADQPDASTNRYYMPHHPVYRPEKSTTKIRIVFNASSRVHGNLSLNDCLLTGSNLLPDILIVLLRFRIGEIALVADIEKAFLQIALVDEDRDSHRFIWFAYKPTSNKALPTLQEFRMTRVTFGVTSSPFLLSATIDKHINLKAADYPETCEILSKSFYVDDLATSVDSTKQAEKFYREAKEVMSTAYMNLRKWVTNDETMRNRIGLKGNDNMHMVLGMKWNVFSDELNINVSANQQTNLNIATKRGLLKVIAGIYDPLGYLIPIIMKLKILFQSLWRNKSGWDEPLKAEAEQEWKSSTKNLDQIGDLPLNRWLGTATQSSGAEVHIFADASSKAYGAVAFVRFKDQSGRIDVNFLCAKGRVAPLKGCNTDDLSLPRLELTAALIAARLCAYLRNAKMPFERYFLWTDSLITFHWIQGDTRRWKPYVFNRVKEILELTNAKDWRHCSGKENPADLITRGISLEKFAASSLWKEGPHWLKQGMEEWPSETQVSEKSVSLLSGLEEASTCTSTSISMERNEPLLCFENISSWRRLLRITAYVLRAVDRMYRKQRFLTNYLNGLDLQKAELYWLKYFQNTFFINEILSLQAGKPIPRSSSLLNLNPVLDDHGLLRVGSRLQLLNEPRDVISPIILPKTTHFNKMLVSYLHEKALHGGVTTVLVLLRQRFWLPSGRQFIKKFIAGCTLCKRLKGKAGTQPFAPLPRERLLASRPFETTGVDFAGPLYTTPNIDDNNRSKVYIMLFTCAVVRAVHLELVLNLTTESCLLAIRRFIARRGSPTFIFSDNAKTFKKSSTELRAVGDILSNEIFQGFVSNQGISWRFSVERAPWWGGFWERLVKSVKNVLKVTIWKAKINTEQLNTLLTEAEHIINLRPLTYVSDDPLDLTPLTPESFLISCSGITEKENESNLNDKHLHAADLQARWKSRVQYTAFLWKRWKTEYLQLLRSAHHTKQSFSKVIQTGDVVLAYDNATPRIHWRLAMVECCYPGRDGKVRACEVRFSDGKRMRRAIQLLYPLEIRQLGPEDIEN